MRPKQGLDAFIVKQYYQTSTLSQHSIVNQADKIWNTLGGMARINLSTHNIKSITY